MIRDLYYVERDGIAVPATIEEYAAATRAHVADERVEPYRVSTVFLGLDHSHEPSGPPVLYETMLFGDGPDEHWCDRYHTRAEAAEGHAAVVARLRATGRPE